MDGTVAILGLGLIGGSLARDLSAAGLRVLGYDADPATLARAGASDCLDGLVSPSLEELSLADCVIVAVPVDVAAAVLAAASPHLGRARLVTDTGSTKRGIVAAAVELGLGERFVGSHPLAGDHRPGWEAGRAGLFAGARAFLCPTPETRPETLAAARELWELCGARVEACDAAEHDRRLAWSSHLPQLASTALGLALDGAGVAAADLGPGGRDATRLAGSSPTMWTGIALENADALSGAVGSLERKLAELRAAIDARDGEALRRLLGRAADWSSVREQP